jgi:hypothetical protein
LTIIIGAIFLGCCILLFGVVAMLIAINRDENETAIGVGGRAMLLGFGLMFAIVAYWSGSWLFFNEEKIAQPTQNEKSSLSSGSAIDYLGEWRSDTPINIVRTLVANNVRGCGEFQHKPSTQNSGEYLVYCTQDGRSWNAYLVWPNVNRISGPARPDPRIRPPR